jgi:hypothetical protein
MAWSVGSFTLADFFSALTTTETTCEALLASLDILYFPEVTCDGLKHVTLTDKRSSICGLTVSG